MAALGNGTVRNEILSLPRRRQSFRRTDRRDELSRRARNRRFGILRRSAGAQRQNVGLGRRPPARKTVSRNQNGTARRLEERPRSEKPPYALSAREYVRRRSRRGRRVRNRRHLGIQLERQRARRLFRARPARRVQTDRRKTLGTRFRRQHTRRRALQPVPRL